MPGFRNIISRDRFLTILSFLHLVNSDNAVPREHPNHDKAFKVRPLIDMLVPLWLRHYTPNKEISIDEKHDTFQRKNFSDAIHACQAP